MLLSPKLEQFPNIKKIIDALALRTSSLESATAFQRVVTMKTGVSATVGQLIAYTSDGYVLADNTSFNTMCDIVMVSKIENNQIFVIDIGTTNTSLKSGVYYVGTAGNPTKVKPKASGSFVESIGHVENGTFVFRPSIAVKLV